MTAEEDAQAFLESFEVFGLASGPGRNRGEAQQAAHSLPPGS